jgi:hypothetical protein
MKREREDNNGDVVTLRKSKKLRLNHPDTVGDTGVIEPLLSWFPSCADAGMPKVPSVEQQNVLLQHLKGVVERYGETHPKLRDLHAAGSPFAGKTCTSCGIAQFTNTFRTTKKGTSTQCSNCYNVQKRLRYCVDIAEEEKVRLKAVMGAKVDAVETGSSFNKYAFLKKFSSLLDKGHRALLDQVIAKGPLGEYEVKCGHKVHLDQLFLNAKMKNGFESKCLTCAIKSRDVISTKALGMRTRNRSCGVCPSRQLEAILAKQENRCYYTFMPLSREFSSAWTPSPERLYRDKGYVDGNVVAIAEICQVGGNFNFSRKLVQQFHYHEKLAPFYTSVEDLSKLDKRFIRRLCNAAKARAKVRAARLIRNDDSGICTITFDDVVDVAVQQGFRCAASGVPLVFRSKHLWSASIDRIRNDRGYTRDNIRLTLQRFNGNIAWDAATVSALREHLKDNISLVNASEPFGSFADLQEHFDPND